jgi:hypothetical protein
MIWFKTESLPFINQRLEYEHYKHLLKDGKFRSEVDDPTSRQLDCGKFVWANKHEGITVLLQRIVLGLEARIPTAVFIELSCQGRLTKEMISKINDPFNLGGRSMADCYYNRMPALVEERFSLSKHDAELWELVRTFYSDIRNKIFHGHFVSNMTSADLDFVFSVFDRVYDWNDSWCNATVRLNEIGQGKHTPPDLS